MTCCLNAPIVALVLGTTLGAAAWGQSASQRTTFADRMAELRGDWSQRPPAIEPSQQPATRPAAQSSQLAVDKQKADWTERQGTTAPAAAPQQADPSNGQVKLPGLGGSPLPPGAWTPSEAQPGDARGTSRDTVAEYPSIREITPRAESDGEAASSPRHSPSRPATRQIDPEELRRELAGSFPSLSSPAEPTTEPALPDEAAADTTSNTSRPAPLAPAVVEGGPWNGSDADRSVPDLPNLLVSSQTPVIATDIHGPKQVLVGREAVFQVKLQNQSSTTAEGVVATIRIPRWAEVVGTSSTHGSVQPSAQSDSATQLDWHIARLDGRASESLEIILVPRASRPLELGVSWTLAPVGSRAVVEVQEPKLNIELSGPSEVLYEKPQVFRLALSNPGTGLAENVTIELVPPGGGPQNATSHVLGDLAPGATKTLEIELTPREAGKLTVQATASAEGGLTADVSKDIFCRKPELQLDWRGPAQQYAGTVATYYFRVRNPGTAPAENVSLDIALPAGAEFASASEGHAHDPAGSAVKWNVGTLAPGDDHYFELKCVLKTPGDNELQVATATAEGHLAESDSAQTRVVALADLKLEVADPRGPVAVGSPAVYEIRIHNRGAGAARNVEVVGLFSEGVEPDQAEGAMYTIADGRVSFRTIEEIAPGRDATLRIRAHALEPGTHIFRAEVQCSELEIRLATEETTRFYAEEIHDDADHSPHPFAEQR